MGRLKIPASRLNGTGNGKNPSPEFKVCEGCGLYLPVSFCENWRGVKGVFRCPHCEFVQGSCSRSESYEAVIPRKGPIKEIPHGDQSHWRKFRIQIGGGSRQGWYDRITQISVKEKEILTLTC